MIFEKRNETGLTPDDPLLTAYAFGELEGEERAAVEAAVAGDAALRAAVAELRAFGGELGATLAGEPEAGAVEAPAMAGAGEARGRVPRFPAWAWAATGFAAAAGVAVMVSLRETAPSASGPEAMASRPPVVAPPAPAATPTPGPAPAAETVPATTSTSLATVWFDAATVGPVDVRAAPFDLGERLKEVGEGREKYVAGEVSGAFPVFGEAAKTDQNNIGSGYFTGRIARDAVREVALAGMQVAWRNPGGGFATEPAPSAGLEAIPAVFVAANIPPPAPPSVVTGPRGINALPPGVSMPRVELGRNSLVAGAGSIGPGKTLFMFSDSGAEAAEGGEAYAGVRESGFVAVADQPLSTFSIDVDTAGYANVRRFLQGGARPPRDAVRIEELINYFPYRYAPPAPAAGAGTADAAPFAANLAVTSAPWAPAHRLVRVGIKGSELDAATRPAANLVFLVDVSGSMNAENKLPLVKSSLRLLLGRLRADDRVAIVTYAGASGLALPSTPAARSREILDALDRLESGGSTNGGMGIHLAYDIAKANFVGEGINRVILCTDGDFNVGVTGREELLALIQEKARSRVFLAVLGFGMGNLKDGTLEQLADKGNGAYGYIDSRREARKVFVEQVEGTLATIAKDVKIQVEFNPARVASYRLIGYENRALAKEDFNNDRVDAGEVGAGHTVTALYEIVPVGAVGGIDDTRPEVDALKYAPAKKQAVAPRPEAPGSGADELLTVKIRYKEPMGDVSRKLEFPLADKGSDFATADGEFKFAAAVAAWGMLLRESPHAGTATWERVLSWAEDGLANDAEGHRAEFMELVRRSRDPRE